MYVSHVLPTSTCIRTAAAAAAAAAGDGAGMLCAMPDSFFSAVLMDEQSFRLPPLGEYAVGQVFLPRDEAQRNKGERAVPALHAHSFVNTMNLMDNKIYKK
jgi:glutamate synthase domain-containing protein 1